MSVDTTEDGYGLTRAKFDNSKISSQTSTDISSSSRSTSITSSTYAVYTSAASTASFISSSKVPNTTESIREAVKNICSESESSISVHNKST